VLREKHHRDFAADCLTQANDKTKSARDRQQLVLMAAEHLKHAHHEAQLKRDGKQTKWPIKRIE
jgi:hypothetical protein